MSLPVRKHLLFVEDDPIILSNVSSVLEDEGMEVTRADTIAKARAMLDGENSPDLVLLDVNLPDGDGISFCREIR